ncbi:hypothetical protein PPACK8108_LOCUS25481 [Phakopsora pachyrhizi]|uniref:Uncharacterized protein n=1 Tax=Phakopsora pachyrhizi TaxID=170000 RepID=A0AAV0BU88_PHAPC|nr:hypothetical protein PPACK8108_LOCUS25481 [Phakopsora pachyrhizi]
MPTCGCPDVILPSGAVQPCQCQPCTTGDLAGCSCNKVTGCDCSSELVKEGSTRKCVCSLSAEGCNCKNCNCQSAPTTESAGCCSQTNNENAEKKDKSA